eukprot:gene7458-11783_t
MKKNRSDAISQQTIQHSKLFPYSLEVSIVLSTIDCVMNSETFIKQKIYQDHISGNSLTQWLIQNTKLCKNEEEDERKKLMKKFSQMLIDLKILENVSNPKEEKFKGDDIFKLIHRKQEDILDDFKNIQKIYFLANSSSELNDFIKQFRLRVDIKDRKYRLKMYKNCFIGSDAVTWISNTLQISRKFATKLGDMLREIGIFSHVVNEHNFKDEHLYYYFKHYETRKHASSSPATYIKSMDVILTNLRHSTDFLNSNSNTSTTSLDTPVAKKEFNLLDYNVNYDSFLCYPQINKILTQFIYEDMKMKPYPQIEFINALFNLHKMNDKKKQNLYCEEIINEFILENSSKEIYIMDEERKFIVKEFYDSDRTDSEFYDEIFSIVAESIIDEISRDVFPKFLRSKKCKEILALFENDENVLMLKDLTKFPYKESDFEREYITKMDFEFMRSMLKDDAEWDLIDSIDKQLNIFYTENSTLRNVEVENLQYFKYEILLPYSIEQSICALSSVKQQVKFNPSLSGYDKTKEMNYEEIIKIKKKNEDVPNYKSNIVGIFDVKFQFPLNTLRKHPMTIGIDYKKTLRNNELLIVMKPTFNQSYKWGKKYHLNTFNLQNKNGEKEFYLMFEFVGIQFKKIDENTTLYSEIHIGEYGGWSQNEKVKKKNIIERGKEMKNIFETELKLFPNATIEEYKNIFSKDSIGKLILEAIQIEKENPSKSNKRKSIFI